MIARRKTACNIGLAKLADGLNTNFYFAILLQFRRKDQNLAGKRSINI